MSWRKSAIFAVDCAAVLTGVLIAAPFVLILVSPLHRQENGIPAIQWPDHGRPRRQRMKQPSARMLQKYGVALFGGHASVGEAARGFMGRTRAEVEKISVRSQKR